MSNENYNVEIKEEKCFCHSKWFKKLLLTTLGTFFGVLFALCLFSAIHKPAMPAGCPCGCGCPMMRAMMYHHHKFDNHGLRGDFHRKAPVKVEIED